MKLTPEMIEAIKPHIERKVVEAGFTNGVLEIYRNDNNSYAVSYILGTWQNACEVDALAKLRNDLQACIGYVKIPERQLLFKGIPASALVRYINWL